MGSVARVDDKRLPIASSAPPSQPRARRPPWPNCSPRAPPSPPSDDGDSDSDSDDEDDVDNGDAVKIIDESEKLLSRLTRDICLHYFMGRCLFGDACHKTHPDENKYPYRTCRYGDACRFFHNLRDDNAGRERWVERMRPWNDEDEERQHYTLLAMFLRFDFNAPSETPATPEDDETIPGRDWSPTENGTSLERRVNTAPLPRRPRQLQAGMDHAFPVLFPVDRTAMASSEQQEQMAQSTAQPSSTTPEAHLKGPSNAFPLQATTQQETAVPRASSAGFGVGIAPRVIAQQRMSVPQGPSACAQNFVPIQTVSQHNDKPDAGTPNDPDYSSRRHDGASSTLPNSVGPIRTASRRAAPTGPTSWRPTPIGTVSRMPAPATASRRPAPVVTAVRRPTPNVTASRRPVVTQPAPQMIARGLTQPQTTPQAPEVMPPAPSMAQGSAVVEPTPSTTPNVAAPRSRSPELPPPPYDASSPKCQPLPPPSSPSLSPSPGSRGRMSHPAPNQPNPRNTRDDDPDDSPDDFNIIGRGRYRRSGPRTNNNGRSNAFNGGGANHGANNKTAANNKRAANGKTMAYNNTMAKKKTAANNSQPQRGSHTSAPNRVHKTQTQRNSQRRGLARSLAERITRELSN
ncbi:hypothetical protein CC80DRAFT_551779 [Byssothecium circinans]|uniref:C3H1-type domain-containing protein n=1 Tax=Byssothecium circinans TaxID=147558 RepID=A0A6A5TJQ1_9PLEO|nr:hypothetical protein CC80DRAFT_551779 [Byssothecium circinans]